MCSKLSRPTARVQVGDSIFVEFDHGSCFCAPGTIWDAEMQMCIGDGSGDINLDGCVQLNDLLDLLSVYGDCGVLKKSVEAEWTVIRDLVGHCIQLRDSVDW